MTKKAKKKRLALLRARSNEKEIIFIKEVEFRQGQVSLEYLMNKRKDKCECGGSFALVSAYMVCKKCGKYQL